MPFVLVSVFQLLDDVKNRGNNTPANTRMRFPVLVPLRHLHAPQRTASGLIAIRRDTLHVIQAKRGEVHNPIVIRVLLIVLDSEIDVHVRLRVGSNAVQHRLHHQILISPVLLRVQLDVLRPI